MPNLWGYYGDSMVGGVLLCIYVTIYLVIHISVTGTPLGARYCPDIEDTALHRKVFALGKVQISRYQ